MQTATNLPTRTADIITFCKSEWGLGLGGLTGPDLFPVQRFILKAYYGEPLVDGGARDIVVRDKFNEAVLHQFNESEFLQWLVAEKRISTNDLSGHRNNLALILGARGCKDTLMGLIVCYELYKLLSMGTPQDYFKMYHQDVVLIPVLANDPQNTRNQFDRIVGHVARSPWLTGRRDGKGSVRAKRFWTEADRRNAEVKRGSIMLYAASRSCDGLRGPNAPLCVLNGIGHMASSAVWSANSDYAIRDALVPSLAMFRHPDGSPAGRMLMASGPGTRKGLLYSEYQRSFSPVNGADLLMMNLPSWVANPCLPPGFLKSKYHRDPDLFKLEFGAEFPES